MAIHPETPGRPNLQPLWTNYNFSGIPRTALGATPSPAGLSPSPMSPRTLPSPMYPHSYNSSMRSQDRALVTSLNQRSRHPSLASPVSLAPIEEQSPLVARLEKFTILPPINVKDGYPSPTSPPRLALPPRESFPVLEQPYRSGSVDVTRGPPPPPPSYYARLPHPVDRRISAPVVTQPGIRRSPPLDARDQLRVWGHVYYGDAKSADAFVIARSLRHRPKNATRTGGGSDKVHQQQHTRPTPAASNRQTVRAIVRPRSLERQSFLIQRTFNMDDLRATIPDPRRDPQQSSPLPPSARSEGGPATHHVSRSPKAPASGPVTPARQYHYQQLPPASFQRRRSSSVKSGTLLSAPRTGTASDPETLMRDAKAVPIRKYHRKR